MLNVLDNIVAEEGAATLIIDVVLAAGTVSEAAALIN